MINRRLGQFQVIGWENGGVEVFCLECGEPVASGGCDCCEGNQVTLFTLVSVTAHHLCNKENT